jgi:eukaryotic-like serine/threonine-protein kinase
MLQAGIAHRFRDRLEAALGERYAIAREIGSGAMAGVYLAHDRVARRDVAIKVLRPEIAAALGANRFLREIALVAGLSHPHIVPLVASGDADGLPYYVMPYVAGGSLATHLAAPSLPPVPWALGVIGQVAEALAYAHARGVVHRDIKPANILLDGSRALVTDFGIACAAIRVNRHSTPAGLILGTPAYMSPEQTTSGLLVDERSDVYSLGCVLYEMLAGAPPFHGSSAQAIIARRLSAPPRSLRILRPEIPERLDRAVLAALARAPQDRPASATAFADRLRT